MVYVIQVCWQLASKLQAINKPVWHIPLLCVQWKIHDDGQSNCPKHVENKFEKWVHLVGFISRSRWPRDLRRRSAAARLLRLWVRFPPGAWMFVCCVCFVLSGRGLCDELITRPEESYRLWCVVVCDIETSWMRRPWPTGGLSRPKKKSWFHYKNLSRCAVTWTTGLFIRDCVYPELLM